MTIFFNSLADRLLRQLHLQLGVDRHPVRQGATLLLKPPQFGSQLGQLPLRLWRSNEVPLLERIVLDVVQFSEILVRPLRTARVVDVLPFAGPDASGTVQP